MELNFDNTEELEKQLLVIRATSAERSVSLLCDHLYETQKELDDLKNKIRQIKDHTYSAILMDGHYYNVLNLGVTDFDCITSIGTNENHDLHLKKKDTGESVVVKGISENDLTKLTNAINRVNALFN